MLAYNVPSTVLDSADRHDERFYNRSDMEVSAELEKVGAEQLVVLGAFLESIGTGKGIAKEDQGFGDIAFLKVGNVERYYVNYDGSEVVSDEVVSRNKMEMLQQGDILISRVGTVGNVCMYDGEQRATPSDNILVLRLRKSEKVLPFYVVTFLNSPYGQAQIRRLAKQSLQEVINQTSVKVLIVPIPEPDIQERICARVNAHLTHVRDLQAQIDREIELAGAVLGEAFKLRAGESYKGITVDQLISLSRDLRSTATKNGQKYGSSVVLSEESTDNGDE